ncbi:MAG: hypothetical protein NC039_04760 [Muribaculaceae bacterium]|nr:hypothetical protein [Muribaculaceae bacterium]
MKQKLIFISGFTLILFGLLVSCYSEPDCLNKHTQDIISARQIGKYHNQLINQTISSLNLRESRTGNKTIKSIKTEIFQEIVTTCQNKYGLSDTDLNNLGRIAYTNIDSIRSNCTEFETNIVEMCNKHILDNVPFDDIYDYIEETELIESQKEALTAFVSTLESSTEYWATSRDDFFRYISGNLDENLLAESLDIQYRNIRWGDVAFSDAYYAWYGFVSSGCNVYVCVGASAVGSAFAVLNCFQ